MKAYLAEVSRKQQADEADLSVDIKEQGRPLLFGDTVVKKYIIKMRAKGAQLLWLQGLLTCMDRNRLYPYYTYKSLGPVTIEAYEFQ